MTGPGKVFLIASFAALPTTFSIDAWAQEVETRKEGMVSVAWLGVAVSEIDTKDCESHQLPLGHGLRVDFVEPKSPADECGIQKDDVLVKFDDQWLVLRNQLAILVRARKPGEEVKLSISRNHHPMVLSTKLQSSEVPKKELERAAPIEPTESIQAPRNEPTKRNRKFTLPGPTSLSITVEFRDGVPHLTVTDKNGQIVHQGEAFTPEQLSKIPEPILKKLEPWFDVNDGLKLKLEIERVKPEEKK